MTKEIQIPSLHSNEHLTAHGQGNLHVLFYVRVQIALVNSVGFVISEEDLASGPGTRLDHSRAFV